MTLPTKRKSCSLYYALAQISNLQAHAERFIVIFQALPDQLKLQMSTSVTLLGSKFRRILVVRHSIRLVK